MKTTVCVLLYGNYENLARRCLESIRPWVDRNRVELRIGLNEVCEGTRNYVMRDFGKATIIESNPQIYKYPMMRRLFNEPPLSTDYVMWFDDDSFIADPDTSAVLDTVERQMNSCHMLGSLYRIGYTPKQQAWLKQQPWYRGLPIKNPASFITGGWWTIRTSVIKEYNWPIPELVHCGGDVALGQLLHQNNLTTLNCRPGIAINAGDSHRDCSAERRGASKTHKPIGM
jgi:hypothetical protein